MTPIVFSAISQEDRKVNSTTKEEIQEMVSSTKAEEIRAISITLIHLVMDKMGIDAPKTRFTGRRLFDSQDRFIGDEVVTDKHEATPDRQLFMATAFPMVTDLLTQAFSTPDTLLGKGLLLSFISDKGDSIVDRMIQISDEDFAEKLKQGSAKLRKAFSDISQGHYRDFQVIVKVNSDTTAAIGDLYFDVWYGYGHRGYSLKQFGESAEN